MTSVLPSDLSGVARPRRRTILRHLAKATEPLAVADLARDVAAEEEDVRVREVPTDRVEDVYCSLHHIHLPKLEDAGFLRYDVDGSVVEADETIERLEQLLDWAAAVDD